MVTKSEYVAPLAEQRPDLPRENFFGEPKSRGTAPAIGLAAVHLRRHDPEAVMADDAWWISSPEREQDVRTI